MSVESSNEWYRLLVGANLEIIVDSMTNKNSILEKVSYSLLDF